MFPCGQGKGGIASWDSTDGTSSRYQSNASTQSKAKKGSSKRTSGSHYAVNLGGAASWDSPAGPSSRYQPKVTAKSKVLTEEELAARRAEGVRLLKTLGGELSGWYNAKRIWTGKDPVTGEEANRWWATGELVFDIATIAFPIAKLGKLAKAGKVVDTVDDISDASKALKAIDRIDDTKDSLKVAETVDTVDDVGDVGRLTDKIASQSVTADDIVYSDKFSKPGYGNQVSKRGWSNQMIADTINNPVKTTKSYNSYTNSSVTNYYIDDIHYVAIDDSNGKVIQISKLSDLDWKGP